ncbi:MAG: PorV/PorQ family protein [Elusimicrobia bacterium]|nr:PorV/PorQ family protein [Elusimicrobiota bacterium]
MKKTVHSSEFIVQRKTIKRWSIFLLTHLLTYSLTHCLYSAGRTGADFLLINPGARISGMAGTCAGVCDDINTIHANPGGISQISKQEFALTHAFWLENINYEYAAYVKPFFQRGVLGAGIIYLHTDVEKRTADTEEPQSEFSVHDSALVISYGKNISKVFSWGSNVKIIDQGIDSENAKGFAADLGWLCKFKVAGSTLQVGGVVQNMGPKIRFIQDGDPLPLKLAVGVSFRIPKTSVLLALDANTQRYENSVIKFGSEYWYKNIIAGRFGYNTATVSELGGVSGFSFGFGLNLKGYLCDYAFSPMGVLGETHLITIGKKFK